MVMLSITISAALAAHAPLASDPCAAFANDPLVPASPRPVGIDDLTTIADIGQASAYDVARPPFGVSPDGTSIAFVVRRANPETNSYCHRLLVTSLTRPRGARELDRGGEFIRQLNRVRKFAAVESGVAHVISPRWSPDGKTVAYGKQTDGSAQIWTVGADGTAAAVQATNLEFTVENFAWAADGKGFIVAGRPAIAKEKAAIEAEGRKGWLYDERFSPFISGKPQVRGSFPMEYFHVGGTTGELRPAAPAEIARIEPDADAVRPAGAGLYARSANGSRAWTEAKEPEKLFGPKRLHVTWADGTKSVCNEAMCAVIRRLDISEDGATIVFIAREGWAETSTSIYRWRKGEDRPYQLLTTEDALVGCELHGAEVVCAREGPRAPRRLVTVNLENGRQRIIFDPNPQFAKLKMGQVRRLKFKTEFGIEATAHLVLPPDSKPGDKHPLVVVQYDSEGFLRGGTGDEVPVHVLAGRGIAVLSYQRTFNAPGTNEARNELEYRRLTRRDRIDRRNVQSAIERGVAEAIATGRIDKERLGISGLSEGTSATQWALINSDLFKVASLGVCCEDKVALPMNGGIDYEKYHEEMGSTLYTFEDHPYWAPVSLQQNAKNINVPILVQSGEWLMGLDVQAAFRRAGKVMELHVFENEPHFKFQPAHRYAMYDRVVDWFAFWLMHERECRPGKVDRYKRWLALPGAPAVVTCAAVPSSRP